MNPLKTGNEAQYPKLKTDNEVQYPNYYVEVLNQTTNYTTLVNRDKAIRLTRGYKMVGGNKHYYKHRYVIVK